MPICRSTLSVKRALHSVSSAVLDELYGFGWDASERIAGIIGGITNEDVIRVARKRFEHSVLVLTAPERWLELRGFDSK